MEIQRYMQILKSRKWVVILTTIVTLAAVTVGTFSMTRIYSASALVRVTTGLGGSVTYTDLNYTERLIQTYVQLLKSRPFMEEVVMRLNLQISPEDVADAITTEAVADTELIKISAENASPQRAAAIANTLAALLIEQGQKLYSGEGRSARQILQDQVTILDDQLRQDRARLASLSISTPSPDENREAAIQELTTRIDAEAQTYAMLLNQYDKARVDEAMRANSINIVERAIEPEAPSKPNRQLNLALGFLVGLMGGIGLAFLFENLSPLLHSKDDLEKAAGAPLLGRIPDFGIRAGSQEKTILLSNGNAGSPAAEAFRVLGISISALIAKPQCKTILFSSAEPGAGKSTVVANLAVAMAVAGRQVIVVDGDLRHPCIHQIFGIAREPGLSDALLDPSQLNSAVQLTQVSRVRAIAAGSVQTDPAPLYATVIAKIMRQLARDADIVLWDSPPVLAAADAALLAPMADGVILVVERAHAQQETIQAASQQLADVKAKPMGIIVNRAGRDGQYKYYYYYRRSPTQDKWWRGTLKRIRRVASG